MPTACSDHWSMSQHRWGARELLSKGLTRVVAVNKLLCPQQTVQTHCSIVDWACPSSLAVSHQSALKYSIWPTRYTQTSRLLLKDQKNIFTFDVNLSMLLWCSLSGVKAHAAVMVTWSETLQCRLFRNVLFLSLLSIVCMCYLLTMQYLVFCIVLYVWTKLTNCMLNAVGPVDPCNWIGTKRLSD